MSDLSANGLFKSDDKLKDVNQDWLKPASDDLVARVVKGLEETHKAKVTVVDTKEAALEALAAAIPEGAKMSSAGSTTLLEIGFNDYAKANTKKWKDFKSEALACEDQAEGAKIRNQGLSADYFVSSASAIAADGSIVACCLTGTRTGGFIPSGNLIIVAGTNKLVEDYDTALKRQEEFCLPVESARVRIVYEVPGSAINHMVALRGANPWGSPRITVILIKGQFGY